MLSWLAVLLPICIHQSIASQVKDEPERPVLPRAFWTSQMWNIKMHDVSAGNYTSATLSTYETVDENNMRSMVEVYQERNANINGTPIYFLDWEKVIWRPQNGNSFLDIFNEDSGNNHSMFCLADSKRANSFIDFMLGFDIHAGTGYPSVSHMLHWADGNYTYVGETVVNGIEVYEYHGQWDVEAWGARLDVKYYWSNKERWSGTAGPGKSVPVAIVLQGESTIHGHTVDLTMNIDYADFYEVSVPEYYFLPPQDIWCEGRNMNDILPKIPDHFTYDAELILSFKDLEGKVVNLISPRTEWYDYQYQVSRTDYKPPNIESGSFANSLTVMTAIHDFNTGLLYSIDRTFGNCTIEYLDESMDGIETEGHGHIHMKSPFAMFFENSTFAFNGVYPERGFSVDSFSNTVEVTLRLKPDEIEMVNYTTIVALTDFDWEIDNQADSQKLIPAQLIRYPTLKYNDPIGRKILVNYYNFQTASPDFQDYDITPCFTDEHKLHLMVRLGWTMDMDIQNTIRDFYVQTRTTIMTLGRVTPIRIQNIEVFIDEANSAFFVVFTIVDYPPNMDYELNDLQDAIRPIDEVKQLLTKAVDSKNFIINVFRNDGSQNRIAAQAEPGSLRELGARAGSYSYKDGYSSGAMAACGIILLLLSVAGFGALLVFVLKF